MALNTFTPSLEIGVVGGNVPVFLDAKCQQRATLYDTHGNPLPGNALIVAERSAPPVFQCAASTVYFKHASGVVSSLTSGGAVAASRSDGTSLTVVEKIVGV